MAGVQNTINYNIGRDYVNCSVSASTVGNSGTNATSSSFGSPSNAVAPATSATATGNATADSQSLSGELPGAGGGSPLLDLNTLQDNSGAQTSDVTGVTVDNQIGTQSGSATGNQVALNSQQTNDSSQLQSSVQGSSACAFDRNTGSGQ